MSVSIDLTEVFKSLLEFIGTHQLGFSIQAGVGFSENESDYETADAIADTPIGFGRFLNQEEVEDDDADE